MLMSETFNSIQLKAMTYPILSALIKAAEDLHSIQADENNSENTALRLLDWIETLDNVQTYAHSIIHGFVSQFGYSVIEGVETDNGYSYQDTEGGDYTCYHSSDASNSSSNSENVPLELNNSSSF